MKKYRIIQVCKGNELQVVNQLGSLLPSAFETEIFVPRFVQSRRYEGAWHFEEKILFPGWVFLTEEALEVLLEKKNDIELFFLTGAVESIFLPVFEEEATFLDGMMDQNHIIGMSRGYIQGNDLIVEEGPLIGKNRLIRKIDRHKRYAYLDVRISGNEEKIKVGLEVWKKE